MAHVELLYGLACDFDAASLHRSERNGLQQAVRELGQRGQEARRADLPRGRRYKVTVFKRSGLSRRLKPETYLLREEEGNLFINTGYRIDIAYNEATDVLTFSPHGDYVRAEMDTKLE